MKRRAAALCGVAAATAIGAGVAGAYVRSTTSTATPLAWRDQCPHVRLGGPANLATPDAVVEEVARRAVSNWVDRLQGCSALDLSLVGETGAGEAGYDGVNAIVWRLPGHCDDDDHADDEVCLTPNAAAITTVFHIDKPGDPRDGEIVEADIVLNGTFHAFATDGDPERVDLESVMTHELGHFLGLGHTCHAQRGNAPPVDHRGEPIPPCYPTTALDEDTVRATMFNFVGEGETLKRTPLDDEWRGLCSIYGEHDGACTTEAPSCGCGSGAGGSAGAFFLAGTVGFLLRIRRRS